ncbi:MAG TPA: PLP-dependent aminotransferase family protein [Chthoniobacter sp.]|nr:PLP-dependent aminotransferase family protein [Chthoniobacter sp.]
MARTVPFDELPLPARRADEKAGAWLDRAIREVIQSGQLKPGERVPSSRRLGQQHGLARGTVTEVFAQLSAEGYLESRAGSGTRVAQRLPEHFFVSARIVPAKEPARRMAPLSRRGGALIQSPFLRAFLGARPRAFRAYQPAVEDFPVELWARLYSRKMRRASREMMLQGDEFGWLPLRQAVAAHLGATRGVICQPEQVMIVSGTQQALDLVSRLLLAPGDAVWMEDPGYAGAAAIFRVAEARIVPVPVDDHGLQVSVGRKRAPKARMAYITPANQFPLGMTLSLERRLQLLEWSRQAGAWIFEDDYDSEFRFVGRPLAAVQGLDPAGGVIFSCSFNKMLFPTLRLGAVVLPAALVEAARAARSLLDRHPPLLDQLVLCDFITEGHFGRHLRKMRQIYAERLATLTAAVESLDGRLTLGRCDTGLQTTAWLRDGSDARVIAATLAKQGIEAVPLATYGFRWPLTHGLHLGFGAVSNRELKRGVEVLRTVL